MEKEFWTAMALLLVVEGLLPAAAPNLFRRLLVSLVQMDERSLRISGLISMVLGALFLYLIRH
jgi:uncharacterized protein YjeT (DUF2065 family)